VVINNVNLYHFDVKKFPIENKNTFFIEIDVIGSKKIIKPLKTNLDTLLIPYISLLYTNYTVDNTQLPAKYVLGFLRSGKSEKVATFTPYFDVANDMLAIINSVIGSWADKKITIDSLRDICYSQVYNTIGKPNSISFFSAFKNSLAKKKFLENSDFDYYTGCDKDNNPTTSIISSRVSTTRGQLPTVVTLKHYAPSVGNQGNTGTCTAWASAYAARSISYIYNNFSSNNNYIDSIHKYAFSPEYIYLGTRTNNTCNTGVTISSALRRMQIGGNVISDNQSNFNCSKLFSNSDTLNAVNYNIKDFQSLINYTETYKILSEDIIVKIKQHLAENKAIVTAIHVPLSFNKIDKTGIWQPSQGESDSILIIKKCIEDKRNGAKCEYRGHAMCIIGYNDEINGGSFEIMNSWGNWWANKACFGKLKI
jgi:C1A family cysteine protease